MDGEELRGGVERGTELAKYLSLAPPLAALGSGVWSFGQDTVAGIVAGSLLFVYAGSWVFANASGLFLIALRNLSEVPRVEFRQPPRKK